MMKVVLFVLSAAVLLCGECVLAPEVRESRVRAVGIDPTGAPIRDVEVELIPMEGGGVKRIKAEETRVLYGNYRLRAHAPGFAYAQRELRIYQPETVARIELPVGSVGCPEPPAQIGGRILGGTPGRELWVKAIPVRGIGGSEARVGEGGYFLISGLTGSAYLVMVMDGESAVRQEIVRTYPVDNRNAKIVIDLAKTK